MKKKTVAAMLTMCMVLGMTACAGGGKEEKTAEKTENAAETKEKEEKVDKAKEEDTKDKAKESVRLVSAEDISKYVTVGDYKGLKLDKVVSPVSDSETDVEIEFRLQENPEEVQGASVETGDQVRINFTGTIDGKSFEGGSEQDFDLLVGQSGITEEFDQGVLGMKKGETKEISVNFPEEYYDSEVAGKSAVYEVTVQKISRTPELTDEWVAANTESKTVAEYREAVKKELQADAEEMAEYALQTQAWNQVLETSEIKEYPEEDIKAAVEAYKALNQEYVDEAQMDMSEFLKSQGITEEEYEEECRQYAEAKVEQNLIVQYIMDQEDLSFEDETAEEVQKELIQQYGAADIQELVEYYGQTAVNESLALLRVEKFIVDNAEINEKTGGSAEPAENEDALEEEGMYDTAEDTANPQTESEGAETEADVVEG